MRIVWDIHGGIHPSQQKKQSNQTPIEKASIPETLVFPVSQHIGAPASPIVRTGDKVLKGQKIAEAKGFVSVPVHASTSGEVVAIEDRPIAHQSAMKALCIVIQSDGQDKWLERNTIADYTKMEKTALLNRIREAGIAGMGGAGFPSAVKLSTRDEHNIETLIINGTECEPYITADDVLMREQAEHIIEGTKILRHLINPSKETLIGVEDNKPEAIEALQKAAKGSDIEIVSFPTKYPSGGEKQLIQILTGKEVQSGRLPADSGIVCQNVGTTVAIYRSIKLGEPLISRITTVTGDACARQQNFEVLLGTPVGHLLDHCEFNHKKCSRLIMGGPMMGFTLENTQVPVVKTTNCLLAPTRQELPEQPPAQACIRCGMCAQACPVSLLPQQMYWFARGKEYDKLEAHNLMDCIECGACSYVCPSNIPLVQYYRASKASIRVQKQDQIKAEHSKLRFEARQNRLERLEREKEEKRKARKQAAEARATKSAAGGDNNSKTDVIQAAIARAKAKKTHVDPAQAAIEKARNKRAGKTDVQPPTKTDLEQTLASIEKRLATAQEKLKQAQEQGSDKIAAFQTGVDKTQVKQQQAKAALDDFITNQASLNENIIDADPAKAAIQKAMQKRNQQTQQSPLEKAEQAVASFTKRLSTAKEKLEIAKSSNDDKRDIFQAAVEKMQTKLEQAQQELTQLQTSPEPSPSEPVDDIVARALAKRAAASTMTDEQKLQNAVDSLTARLEKAQKKLAFAEEQGHENAGILADSVEKLTLKLADAKTALAEKV